MTEQISQNISTVEREVIVSLIVNKLKSTMLIRPKSRLEALVLFFFLPSCSLNPRLMHAKQAIYHLIISHTQRVIWRKAGAHWKRENVLLKYEARRKRMILA